MARALTAVGALLALLIAVLALVVFLARDEDNIAVDNPLAERFTRAVALTEDRVDLRRLARFEWDEVLLVAPDTPREEISRRLGYEWTGDLTLHTGELLIFLDGGRVVRYADYRGDGRFAGFDAPIATVPRSRAVFRVRDLVITPG